MSKQFNHCADGSDKIKISEFVLLLLLSSDRKFPMKFLFEIPKRDVTVERLNAVRGRSCQVSAGANYIHPISPELYSKILDYETSLWFTPIQRSPPIEDSEGTTKGEVFYNRDRIVKK